MIAAARAARWTAIAIALAAVADPQVPWPTRTRPPLRVLAAGTTTDVAPLEAALERAGFAVNAAEPEAATILVGDRMVPSAGCVVLGVGCTAQPSAGTDRSAPNTEHPAPKPVWVLDTTPRAPGVRIVSASGPAVRLPGQAVEVRVTVAAQGLAGQSSDLVLEDAGIVVATARHAWKADAERWQASLQYLPPGVAGGRLRARVGDAGQHTADVAVPPMRAAIRTLVVEAGVTWPALFVRRAIEGEPAFAVAALQRATRGIATRAGTPPTALTRAALAPFEAALIGAPDNLTAADLEALRWFVEERGGVAVLIPDQRPSGRYVGLIGSPSIEARAVEAPASLGRGLLASEFLVVTQAPPGSRTLAATESNDAVVVSVRRGAGAVIFSGALDAWRYRGRDDEAFARFWRRAIADEAAAVPPVLEVSVEPPLVAIGAAARVRARLRATELPAEIATASEPGSPAIDLDLVTARAVSPGAQVDVPVRLWPTAEPGVYEGEWSPSAAGDYNLAVTAGSHRGDASATVASAVARGSTADADALALVARVTGGRVFPEHESAALVEAIGTAYPPRTSISPANPMRSPWWAVPFAGLLCAEWAFRRRRGRP